MLKMNFESKIDGNLWGEIRQPYTEGRFTEAITAAIYHLSETIQLKSGIESDGVSLVGQSFGGATPKIKVTKMETESEKSVQMGVEAMLRGIYQGIRNPRHHEKYNDTEQDADAIILFIDYLLRIIGRSKSQFSMLDCMKTIFDPQFVRSERYADLVVSEIPDKYRMEVFIEAFRRRNEGSWPSLRYFFLALKKRLSSDQKREMLALMSGELRLASERDSIGPILDIVGPDDWATMSDVVRLRIENLIKVSISCGAYLKRGKKCTGGALGTWAAGFLPVFGNSDEIVDTLFTKLFSKAPDERAYVMAYFDGPLARIAKKPTPWMVRQINSALEAGNQEVHDFLLNFDAPFDEPVKEWIEPFAKAKAGFVGKEDTAIDDVPF